ncbi:unnamed protein product, partial [Clonostachys rhizophaga]
MVNTQLACTGLPKLGGSSPRDIRLGDVLVALPDGDSARLVAYDLGKETEDGFQLLRGGHVLAVTETVVRAAIGNIQLRAPDDVNLVLPYYEAIKDKRHQTGTFSDPGQDLDQLLLNDNTKAITVEQREHRPDDQRTRIWYGLIGSGEKLLKNAKKRDELRDRYNLIGIEMEAAGATVSIPVGVIRGVCDYGDERKNEEWQTYAAAMAAAYAKAVLAQIGPRSPAIVYHIPYRRNRNFSGREVQINDLKRMIFIEGRERVAIVGLGGMGKTQIALELAYRVQEVAVDSVEEQHSVFWMPAQSLAAFQQAAIEVMQKLNLGVSDSDNTKEAFRLYLSSKTADGESDQSDSLRDFLPRSRTGRTLITTRSAQIGEDMAGSDVIELEAMSPGEARALLEKSLERKLGAEDGQMTADLLERLTYLPLTIGQAAAYMNRRRLALAAYLRLWTSADEGIITLLRKPLPDETHHSRTQGAVATTWKVSFEAIRKENAGAAHLLSFIQWMNFKAIPRRMLPASGSEMDMVESIGTICQYGFMSWREDGETLDMHQLVHLVLRQWFKQGNEGFMAEEDAGGHLSAIFPPSDWENRLVWRQYLPHVLVLVKEEMLTKDERIVTLWHRAGLCLEVDGRTKERLKVLEQVVAIREKALAEDHPNRLSSQHALALAYRANGQVKEAVQMLEQVVAIEEKTLAEDHPDRLVSQRALASTS